MDTNEFEDAFAYGEQGYDPMELTVGGDDWVDDLSFMHSHFGFHNWLEAKNEEGVKNGENSVLMKQFLDFRIKFLQEELGETITAVQEGDPEEIVDGLIDLCVVAIGTLDIFGIDGYKAWDEVNRANMSKEAGVKPNRPNPLKLPDLLKPEGWVGPDHTGNHGRLTQLFEK